MSVKPQAVEFGGGTLGKVAPVVFGTVPHAAPPVSSDVSQDEHGHDDGE